MRPMKPKKKAYLAKLPPTLYGLLSKASLVTGQTMNTILADSLAFGLGVANRDALIRRLTAKRAIRSSPEIHDANMNAIAEEELEREEDPDDGECRDDGKARGRSKSDGAFSARRTKGGPRR
jgi:hypothetical protein